ncbi:MAG: extracellular solute-binding protein [Clostridiales bacterium]|nr:extracellular solute-binding protein [Clostridiales bacterium]
MKKSLKSTLAFALSLGMVFSSTACKKKSGDSGTDSNSNGISSEADNNKDTGKSKDKKKSGTGRIIKEEDPYFNVASNQLKVDIPEGKKLYYYQITSHKIAGDRILANMFIQYEIPEEVEKNLNSLNLYDEKQSEEYVRIMEEYSCNKMQLFDLEGNPLSSIEMDPKAEFNNAFPLPNGETLVFTSKFNWNDCSAEPKLFVLSSAGEKVRDIDLQLSEPLHGANMYVLENGNFILASSGKIYLFDTNGKLISEEKNADFSGYMLCSDGKWYAIVPRMTSDGQEPYIQEYNAETGKLQGQPIKSEDTVFYVTQGDKDCFVLDNNGISKYDPIKMESKEILSWNETDINSGTITLEGAHIISENEMLFFSEKAPDSEGRSDMDKKSGEARKVSVEKLTKANKNPHAGKTVLKIATKGYTSEDLLEHILEYNMDMTKPVRLELHDYLERGSDFPMDQYNSGEMESIEKLNLDMLSGEGPDILIGYSEASQFFSDDILINLNTYLDADSSFHREDYFDNIFRAFEDGGKLYAIPLTFSIDGVALNDTMTGGKQSWTFADLDAVASSLPQGTRLLSSSSYDTLLKRWIPHLMSHFIDHQNQKVDFESEEFKALLNAIKKYGEINSKGNSDPAMKDGGFLINDDVLFMEGSVASCETNIYSLDSYALALNLAKRDGVTLTGFPSLSGMGLSAKGDLSMSISASSANPDLAWEFIKDFLQEDAQTKFSFYSGRFPVNRKAFDANCKIEMQVNDEYYQTLSDMDKLNPEKAGDLNAFLHLTQETADGLKKLIESVTQIECCDTDVLNIILEEVPAFFLDQRSVEDVCKNIQNRASLVVQER